LNCRDVVKKLSNYLDGDLEPAVAQELEQHLNGCNDCSLVVNQTKLTVEIFCDAEMVELPEQVRLRLHEALRRKLGFDAKA
jgi:anti-sigma factor RsiW